MSILAIIPARGGSKRIPRKNIKDFLGKPVIAYSIQAALESGIFDEVMVSTDDEEIAAIARQYGASVPFLRSPEASNDFAGDGAVVQEVLSKYREQGRNFDHMAYIYPCAPFVTPQRLREIIKMLEETDATVISPVACYSNPIQRSLWIRNGVLEHVFPEYTTTRSQDLEPSYYIVGSFFAINVKEYFEPTRPGKRAPMILPEEEVQDIDTEADWRMAEFKYRWFVLGEK